MTQREMLKLSFRKLEKKLGGICRKVKIKVKKSGHGSGPTSETKSLEKVRPNFWNSSLPSCSH